MGIKEFLQKFAKDKDFVARYQAFGNLDSFLAEAEKDGYSITKEELQEVLQNVKSGELSDEELEGAAGGAAFQPIVPLIKEYIRKL